MGKVATCLSDPSWTVGKGPLLAFGGISHQTTVFTGSGFPAGRDGGGHEPTGTDGFAPRPAFSIQKNGRLSKSFSPLLVGTLLNVKFVVLVWRQTKVELQAMQMSLLEEKAKLLEVASFSLFLFFL